MAEVKDIYKLGQSIQKDIIEKGEEIRIDLNLDDNILSNVGKVYGEIKDTSDDPVQGVTVKITDANYVPKYHTVTNELGQYVIENVKADTQYSILAAKDGYEIKQGTTFIMQTSQEIERNFVITEITSTNSFLAGDILDKDDNKLEKATVNLYDSSGSTPTLVKTTTSNKFGQYVFLDIPIGEYTVESSLLGYKSTSSNFNVDKENEVFHIDLVMADDPVSKLGTINGIISDKDGNPVESAFVVLFKVEKDSEGKEILTAIKKTVTNDEGLYLFEQIPQGSYKIKANKLTA
ncbi:MSCRAMM family protein [Clostridium grantii]|uniref:Carboxypeptidase regulatory-like domain-containing protein n=1 Tax=Clostridium grantii DSM 8605 TaxID=1121316 RepID=A0A1M5VUU0_9CLOT|nr:carboxypeptidase-like regulatory domain-containing protein [Clostridium grantii]SHH78968.1 Carboxypeptidase regulatory-like domain-containing protein [Clostridium grantii DSM 8605]